MSGTLFDLAPGDGPRFRSGMKVLYRPRRPKGGGWTGYYTEFEADVLRVTPTGRVTIRYHGPLGGHAFYGQLTHAVDAELLTPLESEAPR
jgi:hypothetical protein